jgi:PTS system nitrogen regulatory IIA component
MDLTARDAAKMLDVSEETMYEWIRTGVIPCYRVGDKWRLSRVELLEWAAARKIKVAPEFFRINGSKSTRLLLTDALRRGGIVYELPGDDKMAALKSVCDVMPLPESVDREELHSVLVAREALCSTGIGNGVAIPHPRGPIVLGVSDPQVTLAFPRRPIEYGALDRKPVAMLFVIVSTTVRIHLLLLSHLTFALQDAGFRRLLDSRAAKDEILSVLETIEAKLANGEAREGVVP